MLGRAAGWVRCALGPRLHKPPSRLAPPLMYPSLTAVADRLPSQQPRSGAPSPPGEGPHPGQQHGQIA